jgi:4-amino-4-deoxy-L-arabinose transferase-like glycosyltransferase
MNRSRRNQRPDTKPTDSGVAPPSKYKPPRCLTLVAATLLLVLFAGLSIWEMWDDSVTIDERVYLPAGYVYWKQRDFSLNAEHPPLVKLLASAALLGLHLRTPPFVGLPELNDSQSAAERQMSFGSQFLYSQDADHLIFRGRLPMVALALLLGIFVFWWSWELYRDIGAALLSLFLFVLEPTLLAHSHYVTTDVAPACFSVMAMFFLWRFSQCGQRWDLALASAGLGLALASKYSTVFLVPVFYFLLLFGWPQKLAVTGNSARHFPGPRTYAVLGSLLATCFVVQATYLFSPDLFLYFKGLVAVNVNELPQSLLTYIRGDFFPGGVWWYHVYVLLLKLPLPTIIFILVAGGAIVFNRELPNSGTLFALLPATVFGLATCAFANNLGARYMIPVVAFLLVAAGRAWFVFNKVRAARIAGVILCLWLIVSVVRVSPHFISYFNELVGDPAKGPHYVDDSNIDWGQDLKRLARYLEKNRINDLVLSYWGPTPPEYYLNRNGIRFAPWTYEMAGKDTPAAGVYAISVNQLIAIKREMFWLKRPLDPKLDWLQRFQPSDRIGYSIYVYRFPRPVGR